MAYSYNLFTGDGSTKLFAITFDYLEQSHVKVAVGGVDTAYTWSNASTVELSTAPGDGVTVKVYRDTPKTSRVVDFQNGGLTEEDLDNSALQSFYLSQESSDKTSDVLHQDDEGNYNAANKRLVNLADAAEESDAPNLAQVEMLIASNGSVVDPGNFRDYLEIKKYAEHYYIDAVDATDHGSTSQAKSLASRIAAGQTHFVLTPGSYAFATAYTIPSTVTLWYMQGAKLVPSDGVAVLHNAALVAGQSQIWDESLGGTVRGDPRVDYVIPQWWGAVGDGATDDTSAFEAALAVSEAIYLPEGNYKLTRTLSYENKRIWGSGWWTTRLTGFHADPTHPILAIGRTSTLENMRIQFDLSVMTGNEGEGERVCIQTWGGPNSYSLQRGSRLANLAIGYCGTCIGSNSRVSFSVTYDTLELFNYSYAGVDLVGSGDTGDVWNNIYINGGPDYYGSAKYGFNLLGSSRNTVINQLNIEHQTFETAALNISQCVGLVINALHLEGIDTAADGLAYINIDRSDVVFGSLSIINTRMSFDDTSLIKLLDSGTTVDDATYDGWSTESTVVIQNYSVKGLNRPHAPLYPEFEPTGPKERGLKKIDNFKHFSRDAGYTNYYRVLINTVSWAEYDGTEYEDSDKHEEIIRYSSKNNNIRWIKLGTWGTEVQPEPNLLQNPEFLVAQRGDSFNVTSSQYTLDGWRVSNSTGEMLVERKKDSAKDDYYLNVDVVTAGTYQGIENRIEDPARFFGKEIIVSFEARSPDGGQFREIDFTLNAGTGGTGSSFQQIKVAPPALTAEWTYYWFKTRVNANDTVVLGTDPYYRVVFSINDSTPVKSNTFQIRKPKLEIMNTPTMFRGDDPATALAKARRYLQVRGSTGLANDLQYEMRKLPTESGTGPYYYSAEF